MFRDTLFIDNEIPDKIREELMNFRPKDKIKVDE